MYIAQAEADKHPGICILQAFSALVDGQMLSNQAEVELVEDELAPGLVGQDRWGGRQGMGSPSANVAENAEGRYEGEEGGQK